jgi:hypothetical protein
MRDILTGLFGPLEDDLLAVLGFSLREALCLTDAEV